MAEGIRDVHREYPTSTLPSAIDPSINEPTYYIQQFDITQRALNDTYQFDKLALINFSPDTDPTGIRMKLWKEICQNKTNPFAICFEKPYGVNISILPTIYRRNPHYPLWISPRGGGLDCHRTWEAFYFDTIPVLWHSTLDPLFTNLPVIIINDWSEVNEEFLRSKLHEISLKKVQQPPVYQYEKLRNAYWREIILAKSRYASNITYAYKHRCWRAKFEKKKIAPVSVARNNSRRKNKKN